MRQKLSKYHTIYRTYVFAFLFFVFLAFPHTARTEEAGKSAPSYVISEIKSNQQDNALSIEIIGNSQPVYTMYDLFNPSRLILDIAHGSLDSKVDAAKLVPENKIAKVITKPMTDKDPNVLRFEITIQESHTYSVDRENNNLLILVHPKSDSKQAAPEKQPSSPITIQEMKVKKDAHQTEILLEASAPIKDFKHSTVAGKNNIPGMMYVDIDNADGSKLSRETEIGSVVSKVRIAPMGAGIRLLFDMKDSEPQKYTVVSDPKGLLVTIKEQAPATVKVSAAPPSGPSTETIDKLIESSESALKKSTSKDPIDPASATYDFGGYKDAKHISVDFFKIDLHNVFRLFREVSGVNIIVDESVEGSLTLALNDVPWDFALDIILNLKDLRKEERFNTIVIYPAKKEFTWPERAQENLTVEADLEIVQQEQEALIIEQTTTLTDAQIQSKSLIQKARKEEKVDNIEKAIALYEQAFQLDPKNADIATHLANLNLSKLSANSKAVFYAKESLKLNPKNTQAALYAAIALANMQKKSEAMEYFIQSISDSSPRKESLISYAAFNEQNGQSEAALKLLGRYNSLYGESVETMVAKARIYDQLGQKNKADEQYRALLSSGYQLVPGLKDYIQSRLAGNQTPAM